MNICYGTNGWAIFFSFCEIILIIATAFLYSKNIYRIYKNGEIDHIEFLDWTLISLSILQIYVMIFSFIFDFYFGISVLLEVLKFSQNSLIGGILLYQILIWNKYAITYELVKYFIISLLIIDLAALLISLSFEYPFFESNYCKSNTLIILVIIAFVFNSLIILFALYKNLEEKNDNKSLNLLVEDQNNLNDLIQKFATNIKKMKKYYLIILITFTLSFFVDIYFKLIMTNNNFQNENLDNIYNKTENNFTQFNQTMNNTIIEENSNCLYYGDLKQNFYLKEYLICFISFFFRDIGPHIYIYLALFIYKPNINSRSSSFIELI